MFKFVLYLYLINILFASIIASSPIKGRVMGPLLILFSHCLRENVIVTCRIVSFLCRPSVGNFLLTNVIVFIFEIKFQNGVHLKKGLF